MAKGMKRFLVSAYYSDWIFAGSEEEAIEELGYRVVAGLIKKHEWEIDVHEEDAQYE